MPKRKTADATIETAVPAAEPKKRTAISNVASKPAARSASTVTHKRTTTKKAVQPSHVTEKAAPVVPAAAEPVASPVSESVAELIPATPLVAQPKAYVAPTHDEIARLAYSYFEQRGYQPGNPHEDWLHAERELVELAQNR